MSKVHVGLKGGGMEEVKGVRMLMRCDVSGLVGV